MATKTFEGMDHLQIRGVLESKKVVDLRTLAREEQLGIIGFAHLKRAELIARLVRDLGAREAKRAELAALRAS